MKRLLFVCNETRLGGAEKSLLDLLAGLPDSEYTCIIILPGEGDLYASLKGRYEIRFFPLKKIKRSRGVLHLLSVCPVVLVTAWRLSWFVLRHDVRLVYANTVQAHYYTALVRLLTWRPVIWHVRDNPPRGLAGRMLVWLCSCMICVSRFIYDQVRCAPSKKRIVYNGVKEVFDGEAGEGMPAVAQPAVSLCPPDAFLHPPASPLIIANVGQMVPWKRQADLVHAAERIIRHCPDVLFIFAGYAHPRDDKAYTGRLMQLVHDRRLDRYFFFAGHLADIRPLMRRMDILVHCALQEPFGRVIVEAMSFEKPVVAYDSGGPAEIITSRENGLLVDGGNIDALSDAIIALAVNPERRILLGKNAGRHVALHFQASATAGEVSEVIERCI